MRPDVPAIAKAGGVSIELTVAGQAVKDGCAPLGRSFRLHRPRAGFCHAGWCQQCRTTLPDGSVALACQVPARGVQRSPVPERRKLVGRLAEFLPPWFYESRFLRPRWLRQWYLKKMRGLSGAPQAPARLGAMTANVHGREHVDVLVIGGGLAGLEAATRHAQLGRVALVEAERAGGQARWLPSGQAAVAEKEQAARSAGVTLYEGTTCVALYEDPKRAVCVGSAGTLTFEYDHLVIATGAYDRLPSFPGNDLPGVIGRRAFERLLAQGAVEDRATVGVWGSAAGVTAARDAAGQFGRSIGWTVVAGDGVEIVRANGSDRLRSVTVRGEPPRTADLLVVAFDQPTYELQAQLGFEAQLCGQPESLFYRSTNATREVEVVGEAASTSGPVPHTSPMQLADDQSLVCICEDVKVRDVRRAIADGYADIELVKRHTGAATGPCQGKLCHADLLRCCTAAGLDVRLPTPRPFVRPVPLRLFEAEQ